VPEFSYKHEVTMKRAICIIFFLAIITGCATQQDLNSLKFQVDGLQTRLTMMETKNAERQRFIDQTLKQQAEIHNQYVEMQNQIASIQGSIDQLSASAGLTPGGGGQTRIANLEKELQSLKDQFQNRSGPAASGASAAAGKSLYDSGLEKFRAGKYDDAILDFKAYISQNPDQPLAGNAYFWRGEALYAQGKFDDAILDYDTVVKKFKSSDKIPDALYKEGMAFFKMGDKDTGNLLIQQVISDYPKSDAAQKAKKALKNPPPPEGKK
jgi:tol-pal system protein YbgF